MAGKSTSASESQYCVLALVNTPIRNRLSGFVYHFEPARADYLPWGWLFTGGNHARAENTANEPGEQSGYDKKDLFHAFPPVTIVLYSLGMSYLVCQAYRYSPCSSTLRE